MKKYILICVMFMLSSFSLATDKVGTVVGGVVHDIPSWFKQSFLELADDAEEAADEGKHVMLFFHLNGCPYCSKMVDDLNDNRANISKYFDVIAINIKGDTDVALNDMETLSEKEVAGMLGVKYTPTIVFLDKDNNMVGRTNGYRNPQDFSQMTDFIVKKEYKNSNFATYKANLEQNKNYAFIPNKAFTNTTDLSTIKTPLAVIFESKSCTSCEYFHNTTLKNELVAGELAKYTIVRLDATSTEKIKTPNGSTMSVKDFAKELEIAYRPGIVLFNKSEEQARVDGFLYTWHLSEMLRFVSGGFNAEFASFGEYLGVRQNELISNGIDINIAE